MHYPNPFDLKHQRPGSSGDLVEEFLSSYESHQTRRNYRVDLKQFFGEDGATRATAAAVDTEDIVAFLGEKASELARSTLQRKAETLRSFYQWLAAQGLIEERPIGRGQKTTDLVEQAVAETGGDTEEEKESDGEKEPAMNEGPEEETSPKAKSETSEAEDSGKEESSGPSSGSGLSIGRAPSDFSFGSASEGESERASSGRANRGSRGEEDAESSVSNSAGACSLPSAAFPGESRYYSKWDFHLGEEPLLLESEESGSGTFGGIPVWILKSAQEEAGDLNLLFGESRSLEDLPAALRAALRELLGSNDPYRSRLTVRGSRRLEVYIDYDSDASSVVATIRHDVLRRLVKYGPEDLGSHEPIPSRALRYLATHRWALPEELHEFIGGVPQIPVAENRPTWSTVPSNVERASLLATISVTSALALAFGVEKDEEVRLTRDR